MQGPATGGTDSRAGSGPAQLPRLDGQAMAAAREHLGRLVKPPGSLGRLEELAVQLAGIFGCFPLPWPLGKAVVVFAADHGVARHGVSAYPPSVTAGMLPVFAGGGSAVAVLAELQGASLWVVDVGVAGAAAPEGAAAGDRRLLRACVRQGSRDFTVEPAMTLQEAVQAMEVGRAVLRQAASAGARVVALGEMGIANTTAASALVAALCGVAPEQVVGPGTGLDTEGLARKRRVVEQALARHRPDPGDPLAVLAAVGGLEVAALVGALLEAARARVAAVLDGFVVGAAALVAAALQPEACGFWIAAHRSAEPAHGMVLDRLGLKPLVDLGMRLGEASGAALALGIVEAAAALCSRMWTLEQAGLAGPSPPEGMRRL